MTHLLVLATVLAAHCHTVTARLDYVDRIPNGHNVGAAHALGHVAWDGTGPVNEFGKAFAAAGYEWSKALCQGDADGDGQTNGEELGDPCCVWRYEDDEASAPLVTDVLSHPGDYGSKLNATALRDRVRACPAQVLPIASSEDASSSSSASRPSAPSSNGTDNASRAMDDSEVRPTTSAVPTPTSSAIMIPISLGWSLAVVVVSTLLVVA